MEVLTDDELDFPSKMMTEDGFIQTICITKEELENFVNSDITNNDWNTFAYRCGCVLRYMDDERNEISQDIINEFEDTGIWREHELGNLFSCSEPSFEELVEIMKKYDYVFTKEMWNEIYTNQMENIDDIY
jgi:hypothetical protein